MSSSRLVAKINSLNNRSKSVLPTGKRSKNVTVNATVGCDKPVPSKDLNDTSLLTYGNDIKQSV
jgi:hypothetical protein